MTTRILLIRHGATVLSAEDRFAGSTDVELSSEGREQARLLGERLASEPIAAIYASPMKRTVDTARAVAAPHALEPITDPAFKEIAHGRWEGLTRREVAERFADEYKSWEADPFTFAPEGGESGVSVMARALPALRAMALAHAGATAALISHKATIRLILCSLLGIDARGYRDRLDQSPACLNVLDLKDSVHARLMLFNDTSHYAERPRESRVALSPWWDANQR
jgi:probable phosphoglycerate mutase